MKHIRYIIAVLSATLAFSCGKENPQQQQEAPKQSFDIQIQDLHSSYCKVSVTPDDKNTPYFLGVTTEAYFNEFGSMDNLEETVTNFIETQIIMNPELSIAELMHKGDYTRAVTGLQPEQTFIVFACHTDAEGAVISDIKLIKETTPALAESKLTFEMEIDQITATNAMLFITPSTDDQYVWLELPEFVYKDMSMEELEAFLVKNYKAFFGLHATSGEMMTSFNDALDPDTEYMVIAFGYDGGITTDLATKKFRTLKPNSGEGVTFEITYSELTSRSVRMTFAPSDNSVAYLAIVVDEATLEKKGGPTEEGVKKLIDQEIKKAILTGDCEDRAEFAEYYAQRGKQTGTFGLEPGMKHYACAVCVDQTGEYSSEVAIVEIVVPAEGTTDASVTASFDKWFNGDDLTDVDPEYAGWAVMNINFQLGGSAKEALYTIYPVSILEEEGATDEDVKELLLDNDLLGEYNFYTENQVTVQLEWDCDYKLFAIAFDQNKNAGKMFTLEIPALSKAGASPADQF